MSDTTLGLIVLAAPVAGIALLIPATRRMLRGIVRLFGFTLAVIGIGIVGGEPKRQLIASLNRHDAERDARRPRHARPEPEHLDTAPDDVPAPVPVRPSVEPYSPQWYEVIYD